MSGLVCVRPASARWCLLADRSSHAAAFSVERAHRDTVAHPRSPPEASAQRRPWLAHLGLCCGACLHRAARAPRPGRAAWRSAAPALRGGVLACTPHTHLHAWRMQRAAHECNSAASSCMQPGGRVDAIIQLCKVHRAGAWLLARCRRSCVMCARAARVRRAARVQSAADWRPLEFEDVPPYRSGAAH